MPDIFISHSNQDREAVDRIRDVLLGRGYQSLFIDYDARHGIPAGSDWENELYRKLKIAGAVVVLCSPDSMSSRWCFAEIVQAKALGKNIFPIIIAKCNVDPLLTVRQAIDMTVGGDAEGFARLFRGLDEAGLDPSNSFGWDRNRPPFPGLRHFDEQDAGLYFGREPEIRQLVEALTRMRRRREPRLLVAVGSSGSGKSSLIRAGVLPRLTRDPASWALVRPFRPMSDPIGELARAIASSFPKQSESPNWEDLRDRLKTESSPIDPVRDPQLINASFHLTLALGSREASVLFFLDQAEELLQGSSAETSAFLTLLVRAMSSPKCPFFVLMTLRSDDLGRFRDHPALIGVPIEFLPIGPMTVESFAQVIERPAELAQIELEPGLVHQMVSDAKTNDALPLLAFTLREMYDRDKSRFTQNLYDEIGGIQGSVARVFERIRREVPALGGDPGLRRAFLKLAQVSENGEYTRKRSRWDELPDQAVPLLRELVEARLLTTDGDSVEVVHESLFRVWDDLARWLREGRELLLWRKHIQDDAHDWQAHGRSSDYLLSGARVTEARRWLSGNPDDFTGAEADFLAESVAADDRRIEHERQVQANLRRLNRNLGIALAASSFLALLAVGAGGYAWRQNVLAREKANLSMSQRLANLASSEMESRLDRALLLATEAYRVQLTSDARTSLFQLLDHRPELTRFFHPESGRTIRQIAIVPRTRTLVGAVGHGLVFWDLDSGRPQSASVELSQSDIRCFAISHDGLKLAAGFDGSVVLWDLKERRKLLPEPLNAAEGSIRDLVFSRSNSALVAGYSNAFAPRKTGAILWDTTSWNRLRESPLKVNGYFVTCVASSLDGRKVAVGYGGVDDFEPTGFGGAVDVYSVTAEGRPTGKPINLSSNIVEAIAFSPDGRIIAVSKLRMDAGDRSGNQCDVILYEETAEGWKLKDKQLKELSYGAIPDIEFSPDGLVLAAAVRLGAGPNVSGAVDLWQTTEKSWKTSEARTIKLPEGQVAGLAFAGDNRTLVVHFGWGAALFNLNSSGRLSRQVLDVDRNESVKIVSFSSDGKTLTAGDGAKILSVWNTAGWSIRQPSPGDHVPQRDNASAVSPDGSIRAEARGDQGVALLLSQGKADPAGSSLVVREGDVASVAFSPDGRTLAAGIRPHRSDDAPYQGRDGVLLWDVEGRTRLTLEPLETGSFVYSVAFSPDGRTLAAGCSGQITLWQPLNDESWLRWAREVANRNFTMTEWQTYLRSEPYRKTFVDLPAGAATIEPVAKKK